MRFFLFKILTFIVSVTILSDLKAQLIQHTAAGAKILTVLTIAETSDLKFGSMGVNSIGGSCILSTTGVRTQTSGVNLSQSDPYSVASYNVNGEAGYTFAISLPSSIIVTHISSSNHTMTINALAARCNSTAVDGLVGTLDQNGFDSFNVGGTLNVAASQYSGVYTGSFDVTVAYN